MCCFNKVNLSAILVVHKRIINKDCTVKNNNVDSDCLFHLIIRREIVLYFGFEISLIYAARYKNQKCNVRN